MVRESQGAGVVVFNSQWPLSGEDVVHRGLAPVSSVGEGSGSLGETAISNVKVVQFTEV